MELATRKRKLRKAKKEWLKSLTVLKEREHCVECCWDRSQHERFKIMFDIYSDYSMLLMRRYSLLKDKKFKKLKENKIAIKKCWKKYDSIRIHPNYRRKVVLTDGTIFYPDVKKYVLDLQPKIKKCSREDWLRERMLLLGF